MTERHAEHCPQCGGPTEQLEETAPLRTVGELAADLARMTENPENPLLCYSRCPRGCSQCFGCRQWLAPSEQCENCPDCENRDSPMIWVSNDDDEENQDGENGSGEFYRCMRCEGEDKEKLQ